MPDPQGTLAGTLPKGNPPATHQGSVNRVTPLLRMRTGHPFTWRTYAANPDTNPEPRRNLDWPCAPSFGGMGETQERAIRSA